MIAPAWALASLAFAIATVGRYFSWGHGLFASLLLAMTAMAAAGAARRLMKAAGMAPDEAPEPTLSILGLALGLGLLSQGTLVLAALKLLRPWSASAWVGALWVYGWGETKAMVSHWAAGAWSRPEGPRPPDGPLWGAWAAGIAAALGAAFWLSWVPPHQYDSLVYHLALPQAYVRAGGLIQVDHLLYSHFPQNGEMLFTLALLLGSDLLAQLFCWLATAVAVWWVYDHGRRAASRGAGAAAAALLASHVAVLLLASTTYVEALVMLWLSGAVLCYQRWHWIVHAAAGSQEERGETSARPWLTLSAIFTGLALGSKYTAGAAAAILGIFLTVRWLAAPGRDRLTDMGLYTGIVTAFFLPWLVKNAVMAGNPVFPFLYQVFPGSVDGWQGVSAAAYFEVLSEYGLKGNFWPKLLNLPLELLTGARRYGGGMDALGSLGWEVVFWSLPAALWAAAANRSLRWLLAFCGLYGAVWFFTGSVLRFMTAIAPLLCLAAGCGLHRVWETLGRPGRWLLGCAGAALLAAHAGLFFFVHGIFGSVRPLLGLEDREKFLSRMDYYSCAAFSRDRLPSNVKMIIVGEQRGYYLPQEHAASTVHGPNPYVRWANESAGPGALGRKIRSEGYTHLLFVPAEARRLGAALGVLTEKGRANWNGLEKAALKTLFQGPACTVYSVADRGGR